MTFEQWCHSIGIEEIRIDKHDLVSMEILKECWDYREEENKELSEENDWQSRHYMEIALENNKLRKALEQIIKLSDYDSDVYRIASEVLK